MSVTLLAWRRQEAQGSWGPAPDPGYQAAPWEWAGARLWRHPGGQGPDQHGGGHAQTQLGRI